MQVVLVKFYDHVFRQDCDKQSMPKPALLYTVGFLQYEDENYLVVSNWYGNDSYDAYAILKSTVCEVKVLAEVNPENFVKK